MLKHWVNNGWQNLMQTDLISNSATLSNNNYISLLIDLCTFTMKKMVLQVKPWFFSDQFEPPRETSKLWKAMGWCISHFIVKCCCLCKKKNVKESRNFELASLKNKKEENILVTFWFGTFVMLLRITRHVAGHENTPRWMVHCHKGLSVYHF